MTTTLNPYVIEVDVVLRGRALVFGSDMDEAHRNMHELEEHYFSELYERFEMSPLEHKGVREIVNIRPATHEEFLKLEMGEMVIPSSPSFHNEDEWDGDHDH